MRVSPARIALLLISLAVAFLATACNALNAPAWETLPHGAYAPHPVFEKYYLSLGGPEVLGYPISTSFTSQNGERSQYYEKAMMVYDPASSRIFLAPLGLKLGVDKLPVQPWDEAQFGDGFIVGEFNIHQAFISFYLEFGPELVGQPITQPIINTSRNRVEQHFVNLGLSYDLNDPEQTIFLLDYGLVDCESCIRPNRIQTENAGFQAPLSDNFFYQQMEQSSISVALTGEVIKGPALTANGTTDLVTDHMAFFEDNGVMKIRPVPVMLGLGEEYLYAPHNIPEVIFFELADGAGHNIFLPFHHYIEAHGGYQIAGKPIAETIMLNPDLGQYRQCFENYCLDYLPQFPGSEVRPAALGQQYLDSSLQIYVDDEPLEDPNLSQLPRNINPFSLIVWEYPTVVNSQTPVTISVVASLDNVPLSGAVVTLKVTYPDDSVVEITMPPTSDSGAANYALDPVIAENGQLAFYETCLIVQGEAQQCVQSSFMIWGNP